MLVIRYCISVFSFLLLYVQVSLPSNKTYNNNFKEQIITVADIIS